MAQETTSSCEFTMNSQHSENWHRPDLNRRLGADEWITEREDGSHDWCCPHPSVEGEDLCVFHLPPGHGQKNSNRQNQQFIEAIAGSSDYYEDVSEQRRSTFIGATFIEFDLSGRVIDSSRTDSVNLKHSLFLGETNWIETYFEPPIQLNGALFDGELKAPNSTYQNQLRCQAVKFNKKVNFNSARFVSQVHFTNAYFGERAIFNHTAFLGRANFNLASFQEEGDFLKSEFRQAAQFSSDRGGKNPQRTEFVGPANFSESQFIGDCHFIEVQFDKMADFSRAVFKVYAGFSGSYFSGEINFEEADFQGRTYFRGIEPEEEIKFNHCRFVVDGFFNGSVMPEAQFHDAVLNGVDFEDATLNGSSFRSADLTDANFLNADLIESNLEEAIFDKTDFRHTNLNGALWYHAFLTDVRLDDSTIISARKVQNGELINIPLICQYELLAGDESTMANRHDEVMKRSTSELWNQASWTYKRLEQISRDNVIMGDAIKYHYKKGEADRHHAFEENRYGSYLILWAHRLLTGYGDRFLPIGFWSIVTILGSAFLYLNFGIMDQDGTIYHGISPTTSNGQEAILTSLQFSIAKFGFGSIDISPVGLSNVVVIFESLFGALLFALLGFVIARRIP